MPLPDEVSIALCANGELRFFNDEYATIYGRKLEYNKRIQVVIDTLMKAKSYVYSNDNKTEDLISDAVLMLCGLQKGLK